MRSSLLRRVALLGATLGLALLVVACDKTNDIQATSIACGDDTLRCIPCTPESLDCDGATLLRCTAEGRGYGVVDTCESPQLCADALASGTCPEPLCAPGEARCVGEILQVCAPGRNRFDLQVCASDDACLRGVADARCAESSCSRDAECTGQDTECRRRVCAAGQCAIADEAADVPCTLGGVNGVCDGQGACRPSEQCAIATDCPGEDTGCRLRVCVQGACGFADLPGGTPCEAARVSGACDGEGSCLPTVECALAADCPGEDTQCRVRACVQGACGFAELPAGGACEIGGVNGVCNGAGVCQAAADCAIATDCPGADTECRLRDCVDGACSFAAVEEGAACSSNGLGGVCNGAGSCTVTQQCRTAAECPAESNPCRQAYCTAEGRCATRSTSNACTIGQSTGECSGGTCRCPSGTQLCDNTCVSTINNNAHCGSCNRACNVAEGFVCSRSSCDCPDNYRACSGTCVDLRVDGNCGGCGNDCPTNAHCEPSSSSCGGNAGPACECDAGTQRCRNPNAALYGRCIPFPSAEWEEQSCQSGVGNVICATPE